MDRSKWEYKKLGEVAKISSGKAISSSEISDVYMEGFYPCYGGNGLRGYVNHYSNDGFIPVVGRVGALCGNVHLPKEKFYATEHALVVNLKINNKPHFIEYLLRSLNLRQYAKGVAQPVLSASTLSEILISIPPFTDQQRIVAELDCLNEMITLKQEQLKEFDKLAQSIFYDMFGDPLHEIKWDKVVLGEVCKTTSGGTPSKNKPSYYEGGNIGWLRSGDITTHIWENKAFITKEGMENSSAKLFPVNTVVVAMYGATVGQVGILHIETTTNQAVCGIFPNNFFNPVYLCYHFICVKPLLIKSAIGGAQPNISQGLIKSLQIPLPPLALQQQFAEKVQAIEAQKELVKQSIAETQSLLDYTMDKFFGYD